MIRYLRYLAAVIIAGLLCFAPAHAAQPLPQVLGYVTVPGHPFEAIADAGGDAIFVSLAEPGENGIAVLRPVGGQWQVSRVWRTTNYVTGLALTHDGRTLIATSTAYVLFIDVAKLLNGAANPRLGYLSDKAGAGSIQANVTHDDRYLFVSDEYAKQITVINLLAVRQGPVSQSDIIGVIPVASEPISLVFSPDERYLYTTCEGGQFGAGNAPQGAVITIDVGKAIADPGHSIVSEVPAGRDAVRLVLSPDGKIAYVTARESDQLFAFDAAKLVSDPDHARLFTDPVGPAPVGVIAVGDRVIAADSARYRSDAQQNSDLTVLDVSTMPHSAPSVLGKIPAGSFPREITLMPDNHTLLVTNYNSMTVEFVGLIGK